MKRFNIDRRLGLAALAIGALVAVATPQPAAAHGGGGFHAAGFHAGGFHGGGFHRGFAGHFGGPVHWDHRGWGGPVVVPYGGLEGDWAAPYYYCQDPAGYHPDITQCSSAWETVPGQ